MNQVQEFTCDFCTEIADDAVETTCCGKILCQQHHNMIKDKFDQCSNCRVRGKEYDAMPSKFIRRIISSFKYECPNNCSLKVSISQKQSHQKTCPKRKIKCKYCEQLTSLNDLMIHMKNQHHKELTDLFLNFHKGNQGQSRIRNPDIMIRKKRNAKGDMAEFGRTGKFYCGKKTLIGQCECCDGHCGNQDGQNCDACMQLDMIRFKLPKGYLVNPVGKICKRSQNGNYYCERYVDHRGICSDERQCKQCKRVKYSVGLGRYKKLI